MAFITCVTYILSAWSLLAVKSVQGVTVSPCGSDQTAEVIQNKTDNTYTCSGVPAEKKVTWSFLHQTSGFIAGECQSNGGECNGGNLGAAFQTARVNRTAIKLTVDPTKLNSDVLVVSGTLQCATTSTNTDSCQTDYVVPAQGTCSTQTGTERFKWTGSCSLQAGAMTSRDRYRCEWYRKHETSSKSLISNKTLTAANYQTACTMATRVPSVAGQYRYTVTLIPGRTVVNAGNITIVRPSPPTITCNPSGFVPVNTAVTCTCTTSSVGQPQSRLKGVKVTDGTAIATGDYGASSLQMSSQTLTASDHGVNTFRCDVEWVEDITGQNYKPQVGLAPTQLSLSLNSNQGDQVVNEHQSVTFHCNTTGGRPTPNVTLVNRDNKTELHSGLSPQQYSVTARCEDTGVYVCTADNGMGPVASSIGIMLGVQCFPRGENQTLHDVNFTGDPVPVSFDVTAYPVPLQVMFNYEGSPPGILRGITLEGRCRAKTGAVYMSTCTVTVTNVSEEAAGVYQVIVSNTVGNKTFNLTVTYGGNMPTAKNTGGDLDPAALGGGIVAAIAVIVIIVIIVIVIMKRRKAERQKNSPNSNNYHDMEESGMADGDQGELSRPLSFAPMAVYAQVDKKKKNSQAVAAQETNGGQPADVYAQVEKPKKSNQGAAAQDAEANGGQPADACAVAEKTKKKQASGTGAKPKTGAKAAGKPKKENKMTDKRDESAHVYGNVKDAKRGKGAKAKKTTTPSKEETSSGKMVNPEGLIYTSVEFSQPPKSGKPPPKKPEEEAVVYSAVDFKMSPPAP